MTGRHPPGSGIRRRLTPGAGLRRVLSAVAENVVAPLAVYGLLTLYGVPTVWALVGSAAVSVVVVGYLRHRTVNALAVLVGAQFLLALAIAAVTGDARLMLAKESVSTVVVALVFAASTLTATPLLARIHRDLTTRPRAFDRRWLDDPAFRRAHRRITAVWVCGLLTSATAVITAAHLPPVTTAVVLTQVIPPADLPHPDHVDPTPVQPPGPRTPRTTRGGTVTGPAADTASVVRNRRSSASNSVGRSMFGMWAVPSTTVDVAPGTPSTRSATMRRWSGESSAPATPSSGTVISPVRSGASATGVGTGAGPGATWTARVSVIIVRHRATTAGSTSATVRCGPTSPASR